MKCRSKSVTHRRSRHGQHVLRHMDIGLTSLPLAQAQTDEAVHGIEGTASLLWQTMWAILWCTTRG